MVPKTKSTHAEIIEQLRRNPTVQPTAEQLNVLLFGELNTFERALTEAEPPLSFQQGQNLITDFTSDFNRIEALLRLARYVPQDDYLSLLGKHWAGSDFIFEQRYELMHVLRDVARPARLMMTDDEIAKYDQLPAVVTCYRGAAPARLDGICWSLDRDIANSFPYLCWYNSSSKPVLAVGEVAKADILAVKLDRAEAEIISFDVRTLETEPADEPSAMAFLRERSTGSDFYSGMAALAAYMNRTNVADRDASVGAAVLKHLLNAAESLASILQDVVETAKDYEVLTGIEIALEEIDRSELALLGEDPGNEELAA